MMYIRTEAWDSLNRRKQEEFVIRTLATRHPDWTFADTSAAIVHGLEVGYSLMGSIHLATQRTLHIRNRRGIVHHRMAEVPDIVVDGIRVTTLARTTFDCLRRLDFRNGLAIADSAVRLSGMSHDQLMSEFNKLHRGNFGHQRAIDVLRWADGRAENGGESVARATMIEQGILLPDLQREITDPIDSNHVFRVDFFWQLAGGNVIGELDGHEKYRSPEMTGGRDVVDVLADERLRESHLSSTGNKIARFSYKQAINGQYLRSLLAHFGVPSCCGVPPVADPKDPINKQGWS